MGCLEEQTLLHFIQGDLPADDRPAVETHLDTCPACRRAMAVLARCELDGEHGHPQEVHHDPAPWEVLAAGTMVEHFEVLRPLGQGGMGEVYLARDTHLQREVAIKIIRPQPTQSSDSVRRLLREARTTARFNHPNIVTIHHVGTHRGNPYLALEYLDGQTLREQIRRGALDQEAAVEIGLATAAAMQEAHQHGVLHRDLKPENVMLPRDGRPRVLDFGLAAVHAQTPTPPGERLTGAGGTGLAGPDRSLSIVTHHGSLRGTPAYMAPEQWRGEACTVASDVWAFGVMLFEMIAGRRPFAEDDIDGLRARVADGHPAPGLAENCPRPVPGELDAICEACLDKDPGGRPTAGQLASRLRDVLAALRGQAELSPGVARAAGQVLGYLLVFIGPLLVLTGMTLIVGTIWGRIDGTAEGSVAADALIMLVFGLCPVAAGGVALTKGLRRSVARAFLITYGVLLMLLGALVALGVTGDMIEETPEGSMGFHVSLLLTLGLLPFLGGVLLMVRGITQARRPLAGDRIDTARW
jgi:hypothetical protein